MIIIFYTVPHRSHRSQLAQWCEGGEKLTSTIFSMCFLMIVGSALGFTDTAHSSIIVGFGSGAGAGLEFCYTMENERPCDQY